MSLNNKKICISCEYSETCDSACNAFDVLDEIMGYVDGILEYAKKIKQNLAD